VHLYKVKHRSGRILGPLELERIRLLVLKNQITGEELAKEHPDGSWQDINRFPEIADLLLRHAAGNLEGSKQTLKSDQSSYRPILGDTQVQMAPTLVLPVPDGTNSTREMKPTTPSKRSKRPKPDPRLDKTVVLDETKPLEEADDSTDLLRTDEESKTVQLDPSEKGASPGDGAAAGLSRSGEGPAIELDLEGDPELAKILPARTESPGARLPLSKKLVQEPTIALERPDLPPAKKRARIPKPAELARILLIAGGLGYFAYDSFLKDETAGTMEILKRSKSFRPALPKITNAKPDPKTSAALYEEAMKNFVLDHVLAYKAAAIRFRQAIEADPNNLKANALLASAYVNLIDTSSKDETFFSVISKLLESAKSKELEIPELVIAEVEFLVVTGRPDAAVQRIVDYTKGRSSFDPSMFVYLSEAFLAKGDAQSASKYIANFPDNRAWSPRIFYLRGRIAEELGDVAAAVEHYDRALKGWPTHAKSRLRKTYLAWKSGSVSKAEKDLALLLEHPELLSPRDLALAYYLESQRYSVAQHYEEAYVAIQRALTLDPGNRDYRLEYYTLLGREGGNVAHAKSEARMYFFLGEGEKLLKEGLVNEALTQFLNAGKENPKSFEPYVKTGDMFAQLNDLINARVNYQRATELAPERVEVWSKYISVLIQSYEWEEAQRVMDAVRKMNVSQSSIDKAAGDMYAKQGRYPEASVFYRKAMARDSIDPDVYIAYGKILMATRNFKDAPFFFALARRFDPLNPEPVIQTAKASAELDGPDAGVRYLQDELQKGSVAKAELLSAIAELQIRKGQWTTAQQYIDQARQANPDYAYPWKLQAQIYLNDENVDKKALDRALDAFKSYSDRNASDPSGYLERYRIFMKKAQFEKAEEELNRIFAIYPKYPNIHYYKGLMYANMANHKVAADEYVEELKNNPRSVPTLIALGKALLELGDPKSALTHLAVAMTLQPQNAEAKMFAAVANHRLKNYTGAIALFRAAIQLDAGNPTIYKRMGECYRDMGDLIHAREAFQKYLQMEPDASDKAEVEKYL
jgi:tetratricopeptide (TPR) repeat protein